MPAHDGTIAQLVEQRTENPCVPGSNPGSTTEKPAFRWLFCFPSFRVISYLDSITLSQKPTYITVPSESTGGLIEAGLEAVKRPQPHWYIVDKFFQQDQPIDWVSDAANEGRVFWLQAGEASKSLACTEKVLDWLVKRGAKRDEIVGVIGGGSVLDLGLFAASIYQRGLEKWSIPTTLLATVDAGIGGKNGVNFLGLKNYIGTITQPDVVLSDYRILETLNAVDVLNGWMEMIKHGLIADSELWQRMKSFESIPRPQSMHALIDAAAAVKKRLVQSDEREKGLRKSLNFGHTVGHALESVAAAQKKDLPHGIAVGLGMVCSLHWSANRTSDDTNRNDLIEAANRIRHWLLLEAPEQVKSTLESSELKALWSCMQMDKKNNAQGVQEVALTKIGHAAWNQHLSFTEFANSWSSAHGTL